MDKLNKKLEEVRRRVSNIDLDLSDEEKLMITFGVATGSSHDIDELYRNADKELSENKRDEYEVLKVKRRQSDL